MTFRGGLPLNNNWGIIFVNSKILTVLTVDSWAGVEV